MWWFKKGSPLFNLASTATVFSPMLLPKGHLLFRACSLQMILKMLLPDSARRIIWIQNSGFFLFMTNLLRFSVSQFCNRSQIVQHLRPLTDASAGAMRKMNEEVLHQATRLSHVPSWVQHVGVFLRSLSLTVVPFPPKGNWWVPCVRGFQKRTVCQKVAGVQPISQEPRQRQGCPRRQCEVASYIL